MHWSSEQYNVRNVIHYCVSRHIYASTPCSRRMSRECSLDSSEVFEFFRLAYNNVSVGRIGNRTVRYLVATDDITLVLAGVVGLVELAARLHFVEDLAGVILGLFRGLRVGEVSLCKKNQLVPPRGRRGTNCGLRQPWAKVRTSLKKETRQGLTWLADMLLWRGAKCEFECRRWLWLLVKKGMSEGGGFYRLSRTGRTWTSSSLGRTSVTRKLHHRDSVWGGGASIGPVAVTVTPSKGGILLRLCKVSVQPLLRSIFALGTVLDTPIRDASDVVWVIQTVRRTILQLFEVEQLHSFAPEQ